MMKRFAISLVMALGLTLPAMAQMTDMQVLKYVKNKHAAGVSNEQIGKELVARGVTKEQVLRIKEKYEEGEALSAGRTAGEAKARTSTRMRTDNGEQTPSTGQIMPADVPQEDNNLDVDLPVKRIFGHDIFRSENLTFQPSMNVATHPSYALGPGDEVIVDIYGDAQSTNTMVVAPDGSVTIPGEGPVNVAGLTVSQAQARVRSAIGGHYESSSIKLSVGQTRTIQVSVMGEVATPGTYTLSAFSTVFNALYLAGGVNEIGTLRGIKVSRAGRIISTIDVYEYILNGKLTGNVALSDGDVIIVGTYENLVEIEGKVKRPMYYEMKQSESLQTLLGYAGGFTGDAYKQKVRIERRSGEGVSVHNVDEWDFAGFHNEDGDVVVVAPIIERLKNTVRVEGAVFRPGAYKLSGEGSTVKGLIEQAGGLLEQAVTARAVLQRLKEDRTLSTITVALGDIMDGREPDIPLQNEDVLVVASTSRYLSAQALYIEGAVYEPGEYPYSENQTLEDLITLAGGLRENASLVNIEVARRITGKNETTGEHELAKVFSVSLKEGLKIAEGSGFLLLPYDHVTVHFNPDYHVQTTIAVNGEVKFGGTYVLSNKDERISDLVRRAGGLTAKAWANGARLTRTMNAEEKFRRQQFLKMMLTSSDSLDAALDDMTDTYIVGIDLQKALDNPSSIHDIVLREGDVLHVPTISDVVKINGEVFYPNTVTYVDKKSFKYYINQAGGFSEDAKKRKAYILYANGQVTRASKGKVQPGCEIVVPTKRKKVADPTKVTPWLAMSSSLTSIALAIAAITK